MSVAKKLVQAASGFINASGSDFEIEDVFNNQLRRISTPAWESQVNQSSKLETGFDMRGTPTMVAKAGTSGAYNYEKVFSNSAEYIHQISLDSKTKKDHALFEMSGDASHAGEAIRCSVHFFSLSNNEPFVYLDAEI